MKKVNRHKNKELKYALLTFFAVLHKMIFEELKHTLKTINFKIESASFALETHPKQSLLSLNFKTRRSKKHVFN